MSVKIICDYCSKVLEPEERRFLLVDGEDEPLFNDVDFCPDCLEKVKEGIRNMFNEPTREQAQNAPKTKSRVENDRRRVIDLWNSGKTTKEIAKETGKTSATISYHIKRFRTMYGDDVVDARAIPYELPKEGDDE